MHYPTKRIFFTGFLLAAIFYAPWWVVLLCAAGGSFYFKNFYEMIALGALFDILYGTKGGFATGYGALGSMTAFALFLIIERAKKELR